jgi:hypothetical protein
MRRLIGHHKPTMGVFVAVAAVATWVAAPAQVHADSGTDSVLNAVGPAGAPTAVASSSSSVGTSICAAIQQPGETLASMASALAAQEGTTPRMSRVLTALSVAIYCPTLMSTLPSDDWLSLLGSGS